MLFHVTWDICETNVSEIVVTRYTQGVCFTLDVAVWNMREFCFYESVPLPVTCSFISWHPVRRQHWWCAGVSASPYLFLFSWSSLWVCMVLNPWLDWLVLLCSRRVRLFTTALPLFVLFPISYCATNSRILFENWVWPHFPIFPAVFGVCNWLHTQSVLSTRGYAVTCTPRRLNHRGMNGIFSFQFFHIINGKWN